MKLYAQYIFANCTPHIGHTRARAHHCRIAYHYKLNEFQFVSQPGLCGDCLDIQMYFIKIYYRTLYTSNLHTNAHTHMHTRNNKLKSAKKKPHTQTDSLRSRGVASETTSTLLRIFIAPLLSLSLARSLYCSLIR